MALSERDKQLLPIWLGIMGVVLLILGWRYFLSPADEGNISKTTAIQLESLFQKINSVEDQKSKNATLRKKLGNEQGAFIISSEKNKLLTELEQIGGQSGVQIKGYSPVENNRSKPLPSLEIKINFECQFEQLITFVTNIQKAKYILQISGVKVSLKDKNRPDLDVQMSLNTFLVDKKTTVQASTAPLASRGE